MTAKFYHDSAGPLRCAIARLTLSAKVTSGEFDWVLSRIEQDEVYEAAA